MPKNPDIFSSFPFALPLLLDGATGTNMIAAGMPKGIMPEQWILEHPDALRALQSDYAVSCDAVYAPTFGANPIAMRRYGFTDINETNRKLALLSRAAVGKNKLVGGDLSPTGKMLLPFGDTPFDEVASAYAEQAGALAPEVDFFITETNISLAEARAAVAGIRSVSEKPVFATMTVEKSGKTMSGDSPQACLLSLAACGVSAFGLNCSCGPESMLSFLKPLVPLSMALKIPLIAKPNAGTPCTSCDGKEVFSMTPNDFAEAGKAFLSAGIGILGGCCGTTPAHMQAMRDVLQNTPLSFPDCSLPDISKLACTNQTVITVPDIGSLSPLSVNEDIAENAEDFAEEHAFAYIRLQSKEEAGMLLENTAFIRAPLALCGDKEAIDYFCVYYPGKPFIVR